MQSAMLASSVPVVRFPFAGCPPIKGGANRKTDGKHHTGLPDHDRKAGANRKTEARWELLCKMACFGLPCSRVNIKGANHDPLGG